MNTYILIDHIPVLELDSKKWVKAFSESNRIVDKTTIGKVFISTVFLGLDHAFCENKPLLFETMVFGGPLDQEMDHCSTWIEAEKMHENMCKRAKETNET